MRTDTPKIPAKVFLTFKEAEAEFYKTHDVLSDDSDKEEARVIDWLTSNGYDVAEDNPDLR